MSVDLRGGQLADRRVALQRRAARQRQQFARDVGYIQHRLSRFDRGILLLQKLRAKPVLMGLGAAALVALGPKRILSLVSRSALIIGTARKVMERLR